MPPVCVHLREDLRVILRIGDDGNEAVILGGRAEHRGAADIDVFDGVFQRAALLGDRVLEAVEVDDDHVDQVDLVFPEGLHVRLVVPKREKTAVDLRMQGFEPSVHHLRKSRVIRHVGDRDPAFPELRRRSAGGEDLHAEGLQSLGEFDDPLSCPSR